MNQEVNHGEWKKLFLGEEWLMLESVQSGAWWWNTMLQPKQPGTSKPCCEDPGRLKREAGGLGEGADLAELSRRRVRGKLR